jgi:hypothetical protein
MTPPGDQDMPPGSAERRPVTGWRSWFFIPIIFDFVWQDSASPIVSYAVVLKVVKCVLVVLTQATDFLKKVWPSLAAWTGHS